MMSQAAFFLPQCRRVVLPSESCRDCTIGGLEALKSMLVEETCFYQRKVFYLSTRCGSRLVEVVEAVEGFLGYMRKRDKKPCAGQTIRAGEGRTFHQYLYIFRLS